MTLKYKFEIPLDAPERTLAHKDIILSKVFLKNLYEEWYGTFMDEMDRLPPGKVVEVGSGGGFLKELIPNILSSDILDLPTNDITFSALDMPFDDRSISGLFMVDTFHHIPDARVFLSEAGRVLKKDGKLIMIEPANSSWGRFIYTHFHHEPFNPKGTWQIPDTGPLSGANGALPWIVFIRDHKLFEQEFPGLTIEQINFHTPLRYLLSGGVSFRQLVPDASFRFFRKFDRLLVSLSIQLSMFMTVRIRKIK
jgi:SAM-dependent methyltransferase